MHNGLAQWEPPIALPDSTSPYPAGTGNDDWWKAPVVDVLQQADTWLGGQIDSLTSVPVTPDPVPVAPMRTRLQAGLSSPGVQLAIAAGVVLLALGARRR